MSTFADMAFSVWSFADFARTAMSDCAESEGEDFWAMRRPLDPMPAETVPRIRGPGAVGSLAKPKPPAKPTPRAELARTIVTTLDLARHVRFLRAGLRIEQAELARRAGVSRQWIIAFEQGKPTLEVAKVFRLLETLGFELVVTPYDPPPPWMLRATAAAEARVKTLADGRRTRRKTRRAQAREARLGENEVWGRAEVE